MPQVFAGGINGKDKATVKKRNILIDMLGKKKITDRFGKHFDIGVLGLI